MKEIQHINAIKIFAILLVVFNHTGNYGYLLYTVSNGSPLYGFYLFLSVFCKVAVPLFFMCSGSLLLGKEEPLKKILTHRVLRYVVVLVLFSFFVYINRLRTDISLFNFTYFIDTIYTKPICDSYWFLYAYLAALLTLPFIRILAKNIDGQRILYLIILQIAFSGVIPSMSALTHKGNFNLYLSMPIATSWNIVFMLLGYYVDRVLDMSRVTIKHILLSCSGGMVALAISCIIVNRKFEIEGKYVDSALHSAFVIIPTLAIYITAKYWLEKRPLVGKVSRAVSYLSGLTFGVYLLEEIARTHLNDTIKSFAPIIHSLPAAIIWIITVVIYSGVVTAILKRIPFLSKLL